MIAAHTENGLDAGLTPGQRETVMLIATGTDQIAGVQGLAGTHKSFALQNAQAILQEQGHNMVALAPYGNMVRNLREDGIPANTIASVLAAADKRSFLDSLGPQSVVVIDEAGVVPVRQMDKLLALIQPTGAKVVLLGVGTAASGGTIGCRRPSQPISAASEPDPLHPGSIFCR